MSGPVKCFGDLWKSLCQQDAELVALVGTSIYEHHVSESSGVVHPAASLHVPEEAKDSGIWKGAAQMDAWASSKDVASRIAARFEAIFRKENLTQMPSGMGIKVKALVFLGRFDAGKEAETGQYHKGSRWAIAWTEE